MNDVVPSLDTIEFDRLVELARGLIPRYAADWTDHNLHDPGMTLVDLLAWIVDQQVYRAGFVGGRHRRAFAALLGRLPEGPAPARGLVWPDRRVRAGRSLVAGTPLTCRPHPDLHFVLERELHLPPVVLTGVSVTVGGVRMPPPSLDLDGGSWTLGDSGSISCTVLELTFDGPLGKPDEDVHVSLGFDIAGPPGPQVRPGDPPWGPVSYSYRAAGASRWTHLCVVHDGTAGLATTGAVVLGVPRHPAGSGSSRLRLSFDRGFFPAPPQIHGALINVLPVVQQQHVPPAEFPDRGNGLPDQELQLDTTDLVCPLSRPGGAVLEIDVAEVTAAEIDVVVIGAAEMDVVEIDVVEIDAAGVRWQPTTDFTRSGPRDQHYVVLPDRIVFGNGVNGRRPAIGARITHTELARTRGAAGNLRRGLRWSVPGLGADGLDYGTNRQALTGGRDATAADELAAVARAAAVARSAVLTDEDLVKATRDLPGMAVGRAEALPGFDRRMPVPRLGGVRTLVVVPHPVAGRSPGVVPTAYLSEVASRLARRRVLGERLIVQGPVTVAVDVWLTITAEPGSPVQDVEHAVRRALQARLSAVGSGGVDPWPLGREVTVPDLMAIAATVAGVADVPVAQVAVAGTPAGPGPVPVPRDGVAVAGALRIIVRPALREEGDR